LRRVKTDPTVVDDLPDKIEKHEYCGLTGEQAALYREVSEDHLGRIAGASASERRGQVLAMLTALKQICNHPDHYLKEDGPLADRSGKLERATELLGQVIDQGERAIVFTQYREMGERLVRHFLDVYGFPVPFLHGGVPVIQRDAMVRRFQEDENASPILLISLRAGGTGLNLTRATHVVHYDRWWNPAVEDQATDRAYRIGQHRNVLVHKFVCQGTLEERIDALLDDKRSLAESVVGSGERLVTELDDAALRALVSLGDDAVVEDA
jgi:SNF2 family DNA or RNA helicase